MLEILNETLLVVFAGIIGIVLGGLIVRQRRNTKALSDQHQFTIEKSELTTELKTAHANLEALTLELNDLKATSNSLHNTVSKLRTDHAVMDTQVKRLPQLQDNLEETERRLSTEKNRSTELQTRLEEKTKSAEEQLNILEQAKKALALEFQNVGQKIFEEKTEKFTQQNKTNIEALLNPLRDQMSTFKKKVDDVYDKETKDRVALSQQVKQLKELNQQMSQDAVNLTQALRGESKTRGNWGEIILGTVLERSGLQEGREYKTQEALTNEEGGRLQPDVVIHLPERKDIVIDSKVSLIAYDKFSNSEDENERTAALQQHIASVKTHVKDLAGKNYQELKELNTLGYVLMFIPIEPAFLLAVGEDPELFNYAASRNIFIVSPSNLLVTLKTIHAMWQYAYQNENAVEIAQRAGQMYDKFVGFVESFELVGNRLDQASDSWARAHNQLVSGKGNLVKRADDLKQMGVTSKKELSFDTSRVSDDRD